MANAPINDVDSTDVTPDTQPVATPPAVQPQPQQSMMDILLHGRTGSTAAPAPEQQIDRPYMGAQPEDVLRDPDRSIDEKDAAATQLSVYQKQQQDMQTAQAAKAYNAWQTANEKYDRLSDLAASSPGKIELPERPTPDQFGLSQDQVAKFSNPSVQQAAAPVVQKVDQQQAAQKQQKDADAMAALGAKQATLQQSGQMGFAAQSQKLANDFQTDYKAAEADVNSKDTEIRNIDPNQFWNNKSTGSKILGYLGLIAGAGRTAAEGGNPALDMMNKAIDNDINAQKLNNEQKMQRKKLALENAKQQIEKFSALSSNKNAQASMAMASQQMQMQIEMLHQQQINAAMVNKYAYGSGLDPQAADLLVPDAEKKYLIPLTNGRVIKTPVEPSKEDRDAVSDAREAKDLLNRLRTSVSTMSITDKANPFSPKRAEIETLSNALIGKMKTPLLGSARFSQPEFDTVAKTVGDPLQWTKTKDVMDAKLDAIDGLLDSAVKHTYSKLGAKQFEPSTVDKLREYYFKQGKSPEAIQQIIDQKRSADARFNK